MFCSNYILIDKVIIQQQHAHPILPTKPSSMVTV